MAKKNAAKFNKLNAVIQDLRSRGYEGLFLGHEISPIFSERIPSDIFGLTVITGGGIPFNAPVQIEGPPSSFKTTMALGFAKKAQEMFGEDCAILWVSTETPLDVTWARSIGVRVPLSPAEEERVRQTAPSEEVAEQIIQHYKSAGPFILLASGDIETDLDAAMELLETGEITLFVLDSIGAMAAKAELEDSHADFQVASTPRLMSKHLKKVLSLANRLSVAGKKTAFIYINHVRARIGGPPTRGDLKENPGGYALKHDSVLILSTKTSGFLRDKSSHEPWAKIVTVTVSKSKICIPHRSCTVTYVVRPDNPLNMPIGPDIAADTTELAKLCGVLSYDRSSRSWRFGQGVIMLGDRPAKSDELAQALREQPELLEAIQDEVLHYHRKLEIDGGS